MRRRQVSEASGNALRRGLCYKCMLRGSEEHWALAQYGLAQTRAEHSPLISQIESRAHRPARAARHVRSEVSCETGKSLYSARYEATAHDTRQDFFRFHEVLIATVFCDISARGAPVPKDQELTARSRVRLDTCRMSVLKLCVFSIHGSNRITHPPRRGSSRFLRLHRVSPDSWHSAQGRLAGLENGVECFATLAEPVELVCQ